MKPTLISLTCAALVGFATAALPAGKDQAVSMPGFSEGEVTGAKHDWNPGPTGDGTFLHQAPPRTANDSCAGWEGTGSCLPGCAMPLKQNYLTDKWPGIVPQFVAAAAQSLIADGRGGNNKDRKSACGALNGERLIGRPGAAAPVSLIFDTDMGGDCDDVGALFLLHGAVQRGEARLLATMGCVSTRSIAPCLDAINTWFGRPEIPVGTLKDAGLLDGRGFPDDLIQRFPHRHPASSDYPDALALYRQILSAQPDGSVIIVAVGPLRNTANLLRTDRALVEKKVRALHVMGGRYPPDASRKDAEYNFMKDAPSAALIAAEWPTPVLFNGEGGSTNSGRRVTFEMPEHNPLTLAYTLYPNVGHGGDRLSWDPVSCLVAVRGAAPWYDVVSTGKNAVDAATGINTWHAGEAHGHSCLVLKKGAKAAVETALEDLMVAGAGRPEALNYNTASYARHGLCSITASGAADEATTAVKAFDDNDKTAWHDRSAQSWIQCRYADGRKYPINSYIVECPDSERLPGSLALSGSNDGGSTWTVLDKQNAPAFSGQEKRREFRIAQPGKWNVYRLAVAAAANAAEGVRISTVELVQAIHCRPRVEVAAITLDEPLLTLAADTRATLNATLAPADTFDREVTWTSSDPAIAGIRRIGEQCAIVSARKPGACTITASIGKAHTTCMVKVTPTSLPGGWQFDELNCPAIPGSVAVSDAGFQLTGCGHAMTSWWERVRDQGVFVSQSITGDASLTARLASLGPNVGGPAYPFDHRPPTAAGLMIRESLSEPASRYLLAEVTATGKLVCRWRKKSGDQDDNGVKDLGPATLPVHLKLTRTAEAVHIFTSPDGQDWGQPLHIHTAAFCDHGRIGMFVCSGTVTSSTTAIFELKK